jgi:ribosome-binding factor A
LNSLIRDEISELLQHHVKDPRLGGLITVTRVSTSPDLRHAKIFISIIGNEDEKKECLKGLVAASGFLRRELSLRLALRRTPELSFHYDDSIDRGIRVLQLITQVANEAGEKGKSGC